MNQTPNYALNQWEASDRIQRADFNADNAKIDAALKAQADALSAAAAAIPKIHIGTYVGDGTFDSAPTSLTFPFEPKFVVITGGRSAGYFIRGGGGMCNWHGGSTSNWSLSAKWEGCKLTWVTSGFTDAEQQLNANGVTYTYFAIG